MDSVEPVVIVFVVCVFIILILKAVATSKKEQVEKSARDKIESRGIQHLIIKESLCRIYYDTFSKSRGMLVLTWETLFFFSNEKDLEISVSTIRSTSSEHKSEGTNLVILTDEETYNFYWIDEQRTVAGIGSAGGGFATGVGLAGSANPNVREWIQLIDDVRFGRIKKPA